MRVYEKNVKIFNLTFLVLIYSIETLSQIVSYITFQVSYCDLLIKKLYRFVLTFLRTFLFTYKHHFMKRNF